MTTEPVMITTETLPSQHVSSSDALELRDPLLKTSAPLLQETTESTNTHLPDVEHGLEEEEGPCSDDVDDVSTVSDNDDLPGENDNPLSATENDVHNAFVEFRRNYYHYSCCCGTCSTDDLRWIVAGTIVLESVTCILRFGLHLESSHDTPLVAKLTGGIRIHHGYMGVLLLIILRCSRNQNNNNNNNNLNNTHASLTVPAQMRQWCRRCAWALIGSDLIHHFCVLWPITGSPHFDLVYPKY